MSETVSEETTKPTLSRGMSRKVWTVAPLDRLGLLEDQDYQQIRIESGPPPTA